MRAFCRIALLAFLAAAQVLNVRPLGAVDLVPDFLSRKKPPDRRSSSVESLAKEIDYLEHHLETFGTVVPKHPDVWGQARLTKHRQEFEREMQKRLTKFEPTLQGALRRSDQSFLGIALSLDASANGGANDVAVTDLISDPAAAGQDVIVRNKAAETINLERFATKEISLEPVVFLDQMKRYLDHLHQLRRINEGDDTSDSPGYSLNLVRIPISVIPGKRTREGYGAEITVTAQPYLSEELLPTTFRNLVINDIVDQLGLAVTRVLEDPELLGDIEKYIRCQDRHLLEVGPEASAVPTTEKHSKKPEESASSAIQGATQAAPVTSAKREAAILSPELWRTFRERINVLSLPGVADSRRSLLAYPGTQIVDVFGLVHVLGHVILDAKPLIRHAANSEHVHLLDVQAHLRAELNAAYDFLSLPEASMLWRHCTLELANAVHSRQRFRKSDDYQGDSVITLRDAYFSDVDSFFPRASHTGTVALIWAIIVESALLNKRLIDDMREVSVAKGCGCLPSGEGWADFYLPQPSVEARQAFNQYVMCRWPIQVFALDPVTDEQNIADIFSRRRELQLAMAVGVANGNVSARTAARFARRLETDIETIALHRKIVAFSHGNDTFGWRFYPRFQSPPIRNNLAAFRETLVGGPTTDQDLRSTRLEPGIRECVAIVVMPSFVPYVTFDTRANWFDLVNPQKVELTMHETMRLSRTYKAVSDGARCLKDQNYYRPADVGRMVRTIDQLDRQMPLQTMMVQVPYENTLGGFELFNTGVSDLGPELIGWHGAPGITLNPTIPCSARVDAVAKLQVPPTEIQCAQHCPGTTLFLVGNHFSVHDTKVIAGGRCVPYWLLSRQIMEVVIPPDVEYVVEKRTGQKLVDVHVATPYGVTSHLLIPGVPAPGSTAAAPDFGYTFQDDMVPFCFTFPNKEQPPKVANDPPVIVNLDEPVGLAPLRIQVQVLQGNNTLLDTTANLRSNKRSYQFSLKDKANELLAAHFNHTSDVLSTVTLTVKVTPWLTTPNEAARAIEVGEITLNFKPCHECVELCGAVWPNRAPAAEAVPATPEEIAPGESSATPPPPPTPDPDPASSPRIRLQLNSPPLPMPTFPSQPQRNAQPLKQIIRSQH
jgi:hypothetical protein